MNEEKKQINITITDIDDIKVVLQSLENLFRVLVEHYVQEPELDKLNILTLTCSMYFGQILSLLGYSVDDFKGEQDNGEKF